MIPIDLMADNKQIAISREVLTLLRWLVEHHHEEMQRLTQKALCSGLHTVFLDAAHIPEDTSDATESYHDIIQFISAMETILIKELNSIATHKKYEKHIQTTIDHIDATLCDTHVVQSSIQQLHTKASRQSQANTREALLKELLKKWRPDKSHLVN